MRRTFTMLLVLSMALLVFPGGAYAGDGDLYEWWNDDDGDGIPNCLDPDWYAPEDGTGYQQQIGRTTAAYLTDSFDDGDQIKDQLKLKLQDGSCLEPPTVDGDQIKDQLKLKLQDGSCLEPPTIGN